jgi:16S rRNA (guanine527-N7)-methyltransferase
MKIIHRYFPDLTEKQIQQFAALQNLYAEWNDKINVISRKDVENLYERHVLHSMSIGKIVEFEPNDNVIDIGTGGGFPGIPLAILFPETQFHLVDSIGKKIRVATKVAQEIGLDNVIAEQMRVETAKKNNYDFAITRAVAQTSKLYHWIKPALRKNKPDEIVEGELRHGLFALKGGDLREELASFKHYVRLYNLSDLFEEEFFETKKILYVAI